ncbi:MAG: hypothetical protein FJ399_03715 [Verrucomicrobia bacterium]|nr:hypothetical protein [Verrucomicrobiota bacterium]
MVTSAVSDLPKNLAPELARFDEQWKSTLTTLTAERAAVMESVKTERMAIVSALDHQREALARDFARERAAIAAETDRVAQHAIAKAGEQLRDLVITTGLVVTVLSLIVLGLPFLFGYWVGRAAGRRERADSPPAK